MRTHEANGTLAGIFDLATEPATVSQTPAPVEETLSDQPTATTGVAPVAPETAPQDTARSDLREETERDWDQIGATIRQANLNVPPELLIGWAKPDDPLLTLGQLAYYDFNDPAHPVIRINPVLRGVDAYLAQVISYEIGHHERIGKTPEELRAMAEDLARPELDIAFEDAWFEAIQNVKDDTKFWTEAYPGRAGQLLETAKIAPKLGLKIRRFIRPGQHCS